MIVVRLMGGLGNQMFQYAAGRALALKHNVSLSLDLSFLKAHAGDQYTQRHFELDQFSIAATIATEKELDLFSAAPRGFLHKLFGKQNQYKIYNESSSSYNPASEMLQDNVLLNGFWQSEKYFGAIGETIRADFMPTFSFSEADEKLISRLRAENSVALHVRRGDYVSLKSASEYHGICSIDYYNAAIEKIRQNVKEASFYIFSDDLDWCRENFKHLGSAVFVKNETGNSGCDLLMMSYCKHNIIANSSYSWWSAWLNNNRSKMVIAPAQWFAPHVPVNRDLIPPGWTRI